MKIRKWQRVLIGVLLTIALTLGMGAMAFATELQCSYTESNGTLMKSASWKYSINDHPWETSLYASYLESNAGRSYYINTNVDHDMHPYSVFYFGTYNDDNVLDINHRIDVGVGAGWQFYNDYTSREKISYALIYRDSCLLHSFRYKSVYDGKYLDGKFVVFYIVPTYEVRGDWQLGFKVSDNLAVGLQYKFLSTEAKSNNISLAYVKVNL